MHLTLLLRRRDENEKKQKITFDQLIGVCICVCVYMNVVTETIRFFRLLPAWMKRELRYMRNGQYIRMMQQFPQCQFHSDNIQYYASMHIWITHTHLACFNYCRIAFSDFFDSKMRERKERNRNDLSNSKMARHPIHQMEQKIRKNSSLSRSGLLFFFPPHSFVL